ncbi:MAG: deoxyribodipyrimidine photo-lyase [Anaerolineaceae bacterium]
MGVSIWWIRKDLRLEDARALNTALAGGAPLTPLFILDPVLYSNCPEIRKNFLLDGLRMLDLNLRRRGSRLVIRSGRPLDVLGEVLLEGGGGQIFAEEDYSPYAIKRDRQSASKLPVTFVKGNLRVLPSSLAAQNGKPFQIFTSFARAWRALPVMMEGRRPIPERLPTVEMAGLDIRDFQRNSLFPAGEKEARSRLEKFTSEGVYAYKEQRDRPDLDGTSRLSPYLHFGMLSAERAIQAGFDAEKYAPDQSAATGASTWINRLIWREFFIHVLYHHPEVRHQSFRPELRGIQWRKAPGELEAWKYGQTGCPIVDAGMRQLLNTGWMHNRVRMIAASYLVKDLLIDWREGERWFGERLIDYDAAANNGGWQWTAGTGTDAAPYFRIFNPSLQGGKFDLEGMYVRRWVPELAEVPTGFIHEPWRLPVTSFPKGYPARLVEHSLARNRTLAAYQYARINLDRKFAYPNFSRNKRRQYGIFQVD